MKQRILASISAVAILIGFANPAVFASAAQVAAVNEDATFSSLQTAVNDYEDGVIVLQENAEGLTVSRDVYLDLNGHSINGVTVTSGTLYCMDSQTDDFTVADGNYGKLTGAVTGSVVGVPAESDYTRHGYLMVRGEEGISFHCVNLEIYAMTLRASEAGLYYKSYFAGDEVVAQQVRSFGVALSIAEVPNAENLHTRCGYSRFESFAAGQDGNPNSGNGTLLYDVMTDSNSDYVNQLNADTPIFGRAYIKTDAGFLFGRSVTRSLHEQVVAVDRIWRTLDADKKTSVAGMYARFLSVMEHWDIPNISNGADNSEFESPTVVLPIPVQPENNVVTEDITIGIEGASVVVPAGTKLSEGVESLTLTVTPIQTSQSGLPVQEQETLLALDIHVDGVAQENTAPLTITLEKTLPENLNMGNYDIYHVEDGTANRMELLSADGEFSAHNQYKYDLDGTVSLRMAGFSEIAVIVNETNPWNGYVDTTWYDTQAAQLQIRNADQLAGLGAIVGGVEGYPQDSFAGKTVKLLSDIDLDDGAANNSAEKIFYPIGFNGASGCNAFAGTFDGNGKAIANFCQSSGELGNSYGEMGLFGMISGGVVKNLTVQNFFAESSCGTVGVIAAYADSGAIFENITVLNSRTYAGDIANGGVVGVVGEYSTGAVDPVVVRGVAVDRSNTIAALKGNCDVSCGGIVGSYAQNSCGLTIENCQVAAVMDVYADASSYRYRNSGIVVGSADTTGITVANSTYTYGQQNEYWYCELAENSVASNSGEEQWSRLEKIADVAQIQDETGNWNREGNFVVVAADKKSATCYHIFADNNGALYQYQHDASKEDRICFYMPFAQVLSGFGADVNPTYTLAGLEGIAEDTVLIEEKFAQKADGELVYRPGKPIRIGDLFALAADASKVSKTSVIVTVSPAMETDQVSATYAADKQNWEDGTITFASVSTGTAKIVITDQFFCQETAIYLSAKQPEEKFTSKSVAAQTTYSQITLGDLFTIDANAIVGNVTAVVTDPAGTETQITGTTNDWAAKTIDLRKDGQWSVRIKDSDEYCAVTELSFAVNKADKFEKKFTKDFLYRVGNLNTLTLYSLFEEKETTLGLSAVQVKIEVIEGNVTGTYTAKTPWTDGVLQFKNTGVVKLTVSAEGAESVEQYLEVVSAYNRTTATFSGNTVLLNDVESSAAVSTSGIVYGNGFKLDLTEAPVNEKLGSVFHLYNGASLKNLQIIGKEFTTVAATINETDYGVATVRSWGTVTIENCYISGCRSAVRAYGNELTIRDSVIANGVYSNIDHVSGVLNLHNVTTVNEPHLVDGKAVVGLGIVVDMAASAGRRINITGTLTQYNWLSQADCESIKATGVNSIFNSVFKDAKYAALRYTYNGTTYINTGILSMSSDFGATSLTGMPGNYTAMAVDAVIGGVAGTGYVWSYGQASTLTDADMAYHDAAYQWEASEQGSSFVPPAFQFTNSGLTVENNVVQLSYEAGGSATISANTIKSIFPATKYGKSLNYTITMDGVDYTGKDIVFAAETSQNYTITYTVTDNLLYSASGEKTDKTYQAVKKLQVFVTVTDKAAEAPSFTFYYGTSGNKSGGTPHTSQPTNSYASTIKQAGSDWYIMPNASATSAGAIGAKTISGQTVYYPIVDGINVRSGNSTDYDFTRYYPIFKAVDIQDNGTEYRYGTTKEVPATLSWVSMENATGNGMATSLASGFSLYNNQYVCRVQTKAGDTETGATVLVKFGYTALDGNTYYYYVGYRFYDEEESCVAAGTLITLADGRQVPVEMLTGEEQLLVWNLETGAYDSAPIVFVDSDEETEYEIIHLYFSDGSDVEVIYEHGFFNLDLGEYVYLDSGNAADYIGHRFVAQGDISQNTWNAVTLTDVVIEKKITTAYSPVTAEHLCYYVDGVLSMPGGIDGLFNIFEVDTQTMTYDAEKMAADIATYGLYTYDDFADLIPEEAFVVFNGAWLKVAIGKGMLTWEDIACLAERYVPLM